MGFDWRNQWPPASKPIAVEGGLATKRSRGAIGDTWWSKRFITVLESFGLDNRLARGRSYARKGQVVSMDINAGFAQAVVQGSRARPYRVLIGVDELRDVDWQIVENALASKAVFLAKLLAGEMPHNIEDVFAECKLSLFPKRLSELDTTCSCPDVANPCKHIAAAYYLLAERFDDDPFLIFQWRGRDRETLLASLGNSNSNVDEVHVIDEQGIDYDESWPQFEPGDEGATNDFWLAGDSLTAVKPRVETSPSPDVLIRQMDAIDFEVRSVNLVEMLAPLYSKLAQDATGAASTVDE